MSRYCATGARNPKLASQSASGAAKRAPLYTPASTPISVMQNCTVERKRVGSSSSRNAARAPPLRFASCRSRVTREEKARARPSRTGRSRARAPSGSGSERASCAGRAGCHDSSSWRATGPDCGCEPPEARPQDDRLQQRRLPPADRRLRHHRLDRHLRAARVAARPAGHRRRHARAGRRGATADQPVDPRDRARQPRGRAALRPLRAPAGRAASLGLFIAGSLAGIVAPTLDLLVVARVVQAFGGGAAMSVMRATILDHFGPAKAAGALAATATAILVAPMLAPTLGGLAIEWLDWRAVFALSGLLGCAVLCSRSRNLREHCPPTGRRDRRCVSGRITAACWARANTSPSWCSARAWSA